MYPSELTDRPGSAEARTGSCGEDDFRLREWQLRISGTMRHALEIACRHPGSDLACVRAMVDAVRRIPPLVMPGSRSARAELSSAFIQGTGSEVVPIVGGLPQPARELADLLVLGTCFDGSGDLVWQKACFVQTKRVGVKTRSGDRFDVDRGQLVLLDAFPPFRRKTGFLANRDMRLRNPTGMLGAYGLLIVPGDIAMISARVLARVLGGRRSMSVKEIAPILAAGASGPIVPDRSCRSPMAGAWRSGVLSCLGVDEFVRDWTDLLVGEAWSPRFASRESSDLARCVLRAVEHAGKDDGSLAGLAGRMRSALARLAAEPVDESIPEFWGENGLGILSASLTEPSSIEQ